MKRRWMRRKLKVPTRKGLREIAIRNSRQASQIGRYWNAVHRYLATGDAKALRKFKGIRMTDKNGDQVPLLTDLDDLDRLGNAGVLSFESIYARKV